MSRYSTEDAEAEENLDRLFRIKTILGYFLTKFGTVYKQKQYLSLSDNAAKRLWSGQFVKVMRDTFATWNFIQAIRKKKLRGYSSVSSWLQSSFVA